MASLASLKPRHENPITSKDIIMNVPEGVSNVDWGVHPESAFQSPQENSFIPTAQQGYNDNYNGGGKNRVSTTGSNVNTSSPENNILGNNKTQNKQNTQLPRVAGLVRKSSFAPTDGKKKVTGKNLTKQKSGPIKPSESQQKNAKPTAAVSSHTTQESLRDGGKTSDDGSNNEKRTPLHHGQEPKSSILTYEQMQRLQGSIRPEWEQSMVEDSAVSRNRQLMNQTMSSGQSGEAVIFGDAPQDWQNLPRMTSKEIAIQQDLAMQQQRSAHSQLVAYQQALQQQMILNQHSQHPQQAQEQELLKQRHMQHQRQHFYQLQRMQQQEQELEQLQRMQQQQQMYSADQALQSFAQHPENLGPNPENAQQIMQPPPPQMVQNYTGYPPPNQQESYPFHGAQEAPQHAEYPLVGTTALLQPGASYLGSMQQNFPHQVQENFLYPSGQQVFGNPMQQNFVHGMPQVFPNQIQSGGYMQNPGNGIYDTTIQDTPLTSRLSPRGEAIAAEAASVLIRAGVQSWEDLRFPVAKGPETGRFDGGLQYAEELDSFFQGQEVVLKEKDYVHHLPINKQMEYMNRRNQMVASRNPVQAAPANVELPAPMAAPRIPTTHIKERKSFAAGLLEQFTGNPGRTGCTKLLGCFRTR